MKTAQGGRGVKVCRVLSVLYLVWHELMQLHLFDEKQSPRYEGQSLLLS